MAGGAGQKGAIYGINITPLVDVTLVLLIIFIVTAKVVVTPSVPMSLPKASSSEGVQVIYSVLLTRDGRWLVNGARVANAEALKRSATEALKAEGAELQAVIQADGDVPHRRVIEALDALRLAGVKRVAFATLPPPSSPVDPTEELSP